MSLLINLRHLEQKDVVLAGELTATELDIETLDEMMRVTNPLEYELTAQQMHDGILVQGWWRLELDCECSRCLKPFKHMVELDEWNCLIPLEGEDAVAVKDDCVDLTPFLREDILLELPQRPLCKPECPGLPKNVAAKLKKDAQTGQAQANQSAWAELNKLKF